MVKGFKSGIDIDVLLQKYKCTKSTIIRNLKNNLGELKYKELFNENKLLKRKSKTNKKQKINLLERNINKEDLKNYPNDPKVFNESLTASNFEPIDSFFEIAPIDYEIDNSSRPELSSVPISKIDFPKIVYMIVDKKIELETKLLKDYAEWQFLSMNELNRKTIQIFDDLKNAKRFCNKEQKVIKVPNTDVFKIVAPILVSRGISRIVSGDKLIAL